MVRLAGIWKPVAKRRKIVNNSGDRKTSCTNAYKVGQVSISSKALLSIG
jgi:hypothetical protein